MLPYSLASYTLGQSAVSQLTGDFTCGCPAKVGVARVSGSDGSSSKTDTCAALVMSYSGAWEPLVCSSQAGKKSRNRDIKVFFNAVSSLPVLHPKSILGDGWLKYVEILCPIET